MCNSRPFRLLPRLLRRHMNMGMQWNTRLMRLDAGSTLMELLRSLAITGTEEVLSISGLILLLAAAWGGDKASRAISIAAVAVLTVCAVLTAPALCQAAMGPAVSAWNGQFSGDAFAAFAKLLIYAAAGASLLVAPAFFEQAKAMRAPRGRHARH